MKGNRTDGIDRNTQRSSNRLQLRLLRLVLITVTGFGILFSFITYILFHNYLERSLINSCYINLEYLSDSINSNITDVSDLIRFGQSNSAIGKYISQPDDSRYAEAAINAHDRLTEEIQNSPIGDSIQRIVIINAHDRFIQNVSVQYSTRSDLAKDIPGLSFFNELVEKNGIDLSQGFMKDPLYKENPPSILPCIRPVYADYISNEIGYIYIALTERLFLEPIIKYGAADDSTLYMIFGDHVYIADTESNTLRETSAPYSPDEKMSIRNLDPSIEVYRAQNENGRMTTFVVHPLFSDNCYLAKELSENDFYSQYRIIIILILIIFLSLFILGLFLTYLLRNNIAVPVGKLKKQIEMVALGDFTKNSEIERDDELGDVGTGINIMSEKIEQLLESRITAEKEKKELEYRMLLNQINPHFIYNTLNSIKWMAIAQGTDGIADMTTSLAHLLRSVSKGTDLNIPVSEELELSREYFNIQNYRYGGTIKLTINCPDDCINCKILKFTLQPLLENAIFHGLEPKGGAGKIDINVSRTVINERAAIDITVHDDGVGIPKEKALKILNENNSSSNELFREIGIYNVNKRLKYEYGKDYGIRIDSVSGKYTDMHVIIPASDDQEV
ncbi:MAG: histidine kinase [Lachnospiraceae bacterium]|nr:histidine kinase [Lachnospiraceae bacterium]